MELDTDVLDEELDAAPPLKTRRLTRRAALARRPRLVLLPTAAETSAPQRPLLPPRGQDTSEATSSWHGAARSWRNPEADRRASRYGRLASSWTGGAETAVAAGERVDAAVSLAHMCLSYYGFGLDASDQNPEETIRMRLLCLTDRIATGLGGRFGLGVPLVDALLTTSVILIKMWTDQSCHFKLLEWRKADVRRVAQLERCFLAAIHFKTHLSHANIYDFSSRLRSFEDV